MSSKTILITGTSSGIGRALVEASLSLNYTVVATLRDPSVLSTLSSQYDSSKLLVLPLDITDGNQVTKVFERVKKEYGQLDVVVNNAGYAVLGEVEGTPDDVARKMFETNFWGTLNVTRKAVEFFRDHNKEQGGRIIQVSSYLGTHPGLGTGTYSASKAALDAVTQSLSEELDPSWNIKVSLIIPGGFRTSGSKSSIIPPAHPAYTSPTHPITQFRSLISQPDVVAQYLQGDPAKAAKFILDVVREETPRSRYAMGGDAVDSIREQMKRVEEDLEACEEKARATCFRVEQH